jgi:hypothetical protein
VAYFVPCPHLRGPTLCRGYRALASRSNRRPVVCHNRRTLKGWSKFGNARSSATPSSPPEMPQRIRDFKGPGYTKFLERLVHELEEEVQHLRQRSCPACAAAVHQLSTPSRGLIIQFETRPTKPSSKAWEVIHEFSAQVPRDEEGWSAKRKRARFCELKQVIYTFYLPTRHSQRLRSLDIGGKPDGETGILDVLGDYRVFANALAAHRIYATQISYYSTLLFICLCIICPPGWSRTRFCRGSFERVLDGTTREEM